MPHSHTSKWRRRPQTHGRKAVLQPQQAETVRRIYLHGRHYGQTQRQVGRWFGVSQPTVSRCVTGTYASLRA